MVVTCQNIRKKKVELTGNEELTIRGYRTTPEGSVRTSPKPPLAQQQAVQPRESAESLQGASSM